MDFLSGGGKLGELIRSHDWSKTPLGPVDRWPQSLRSALSICLGSAFPIGIYWGEELTLLYNDAWSPIPGTKHPGALGKPAIEVWPDIWDDIGPLFRKVAKTGEASRSIDALLAMQRHGYTEECYFDFTFTPIRGENGKVEGIFNAVIETTYRVISERRNGLLKGLTEKLNLAKSIPEVLSAAAGELEKAVKDVPFALVYLNSEDNRRTDLVLSTGAKPESPSSVALNGEGQPWPFDEAAKTGKSYHVQDISVLFNESVESAWPEATTEALIIPIGFNKEIGFLVCGINPRRTLDTEHQGFLESLASRFSSAMYHIGSLEEERQRAGKLAEIDRAKTVFFNNVSHEFRTPLTLILGPIQDLLNESEDPAHREQLELVQRNSLRLQKLVNALLDFSRIEAGRLKANYVPTDVAGFTAELASNFRSAIEKAGMELILQAPPLTSEVYVDRDMWEKVILNLLSNALKFTFSGTITVTLSEQATHVTLLVSDTGEGIPPEDLPHIFERFKRVEGARSRAIAGSGIGLSLVHDLVQLHGGTISVESSEGKGSTFRIMIPKGTGHLPKDRIQSINTAPAFTASKAHLADIDQWLDAEHERLDDLMGAGDSVHSSREISGRTPYRPGRGQPGHAELH